MAVALKWCILDPYLVSRVCPFWNMTEDFSPKALVVVERLLELLG